MRGPLGGVLLPLAAGLAACGGATTTVVQRPITPVAIYPTPPALTDAADPEPTGGVWLLAGPRAARVVVELDLIDGRIVERIAVPSPADTITQIPDGPILVAVPGATASTVEVIDPETGRVSTAWRLPGSVISLRAGPTATWVLIGLGRAKALLHVGPDGRVTQVVRVAADAAAIATDPVGEQVYVAERDGTIDTISGTGRVTTSFTVGGSLRGIVADPTDRRLLVLRHADGTLAVDVVDLDTQGIDSVLPAPASCTGLFVGENGAGLYMLVGTDTVGNVQLFSLR